MNNQNDYFQLWPLGGLFRFMDKHNLLANVILFIEVVALLYAVLTYNFTTNI